MGVSAAVSTCNRFVANKKNIYNGNKALQKFDKLKGDLIKKATEEKVKSYSVKIEGCKVVKNNLLK